MTPDDLEHQLLTVDKLQQLVDNWIKTYGVRYFNELTNMCCLTEEVGELARVIARKYGEQSSKDTDLQYKLEDELADVLWVLVCWRTRQGLTLPMRLSATSTKRHNAITIVIKITSN